LKIHPPNLIRLAYSRNKRHCIVADVLFPPILFIGFGEREALQTICSTFPICQDIAY
jgi:hypothetical protein